MKKIIVSLLLACPLTMMAQQMLTLDECLQRAVKYNHTLQQAELDIIAAREQKSEAFTNFFPQIQANAMAFKTFTKLGEASRSGGGEVLPDDPEKLETIKDMFTIFGGFTPSLELLAPADMGYSYSDGGFDAGYVAAVSAVQPIYMGGRIINGNKLAKLGIEAAELKHVVKEKEVLQKVTECYWQLATVKYNLRTIEAAEKQIAAVKTRIQDLVDAGVITRNALLQVRLREQELASTRVKLENGDQLLRLLLAQQIGVIDKEIDIVLQEMDVTPELPVFDNSASNTRTELQLANAAIEAERLKVRMERGKLLPMLGVGVAGFRLAANLSSIDSHLSVNSTGPLAEIAPDMASKDFDMSYQPKKSKNIGMAFATLSIPISQWWGGTHAVRRQKARQLQAEITYDDAKEKLAIDNRSAYLKVIEAHKQIGIARTSVEEAEENLRIHTEQYQTGTITISELLDAETLNRKAHDQLSSSVADYQIRLADYQRKVSAN